MTLRLPALAAAAAVLLGAFLARGAAPDVVAVLFVIAWAFVCFADKAEAEAEAEKTDDPRSSRDRRP